MIQPKITLGLSPSAQLLLKNIFRIEHDFGIKVYERRRADNTYNESRSTKICDKYVASPLTCPYAGYVQFTCLVRGFL